MCTQIRNLPPLMTDKRLLAVVGRTGFGFTVWLWLFTKYLFKMAHEVGLLGDKMRCAQRIKHRGPVVQ